MFEDITVVPSAISAFNNAALVAPAFLWNALLCLPIFVAAFWFGRTYKEKANLNKYLSWPRASFWTVVMVIVWFVLMGGNYSVLRDGVSVLPWLSAVLLFVSGMFIGFRTKDVSLPLWYGTSNVTRRKKWIVNILVACLVLIPVGLSDTLNWWGPVLQVSSVLAGLFVGRKWLRRDMPMAFLLTCILLVMTAVLMQPEYFRFGQLGNLTPWHLLWVLLTGAVFSVTVALKIVRAREKIHHSAFIKIKWLLRFVATLCAVLFVLTEAVPMFLATIAMVWGLSALSVWHLKETDKNIADFFCALLLVLFGVLISVPTISVLGLLQISVSPSNKRMSVIRGLL